MYVYSFTKYGGFDRVFRCSEVSTPKIWTRSMKAGDLVMIDEEYFLCLGEKLSFWELYLTVPTLRIASYTLVYKWFLGTNTLALLHRMVATYFTTYKAVVKHFLSDDIEKLLKRELKLVKKDKNWSKSSKVEGFTLAEKGQTMIVFPDLRTLRNMIPEDVQKIPDDIEKSCLPVRKIPGGWNIVTLLASQTQNQKDLHRWQVKLWTVSVVICTYAEIFQDFHDLQKIIWVDPHKWYYAHQQDPRYKVGDVLEKLSQLRGADMVSMGI